MWWGELPLWSGRRTSQPAHVGEGPAFIELAGRHEAREPEGADATVDPAGLAGPIDLGEVAGILDAVAAGKAHEIFPERQINNMKIADPAAGDAPSHGAAGPQSVLGNGEHGPTTENGVRSGVPGDEADTNGVKPEPQYESDPKRPSSDPENDQPADKHGHGNPTGDADKTAETADDANAPGVSEGSSDDGSADAATDEETK